MGYTKKELLCMIEQAALDMPTFYKCDFINYRGATADTHEYYTEVIAEWLLSNLSKLDEIKTIERESGYYIPTHDGISDNPGSNREEEIIAMDMFRQGDIDGLGRVFDYQTPLKNKRSDRAGKIDLLSYENKTLHILELKEPDSSESMLRCVLEGYTYLRTVHHGGLLDSFNLSRDTDVKTNPLVALNGYQHRELKDGRPMLRRLMEALDVIPIYYYSQNGIYKVNGE